MKSIPAATEEEVEATVKVMGGEDWKLWMQALKDADVTLDDLDAIGVTYGPGLVGALLVGVAEAKAIAYVSNLF